MKIWITKIENNEETFPIKMFSNGYVSGLFPHGVAVNMVDRYILAWLEFELGNNHVTD